MPDPISTNDAKRGIRRILNGGRIVWTQHARDEMANDDLTTVDCVNVLRGGVVQPPDFIRGTWRYRVESRTIAVVIAFGLEDELRVVTAWRKEEKPR